MKSLTERRDANAKEILTRSKMMQEPGENMFSVVYKTAWDDCVTELGRDVGFDEKAAWDKAAEYLKAKATIHGGENKTTATDIKEFLLYMLRWQAQQDAARIGAIKNGYEVAKIIIEAKEAELEKLRAAGYQFLSNCGFECTCVSHKDLALMCNACQFKKALKAQAGR